MNTIYGSIALIILIVFCVFALPFISHADVADVQSQLITLYRQLIALLMQEIALMQTVPQTTPAVPELHVQPPPDSSHTTQTLYFTYAPSPSVAAATSTAMKASTTPFGGSCTSADGITIPNGKQLIPADQGLGGHAISFYYTCVDGKWYSMGTTLVTTPPTGGGDGCSIGTNYPNSGSITNCLGQYYCGAGQTGYWSNTSCPMNQQGVASGPSAGGSTTMLIGGSCVLSGGSYICTYQPAPNLGCTQTGASTWTCPYRSSYGCGAGPVSFVSPYPCRYSNYVSF